MISTIAVGTDVFEISATERIFSRSGLSRNEVINKLRLQPYLNAMN